MATVHLGRLLGPVGFSRTVAIKRLHAQYASDPEFVSMFHDEARVAARIRHPNVVPTLDVVSADGELFLVMDYVPGESIARLSRAVRERRETFPLRVLAAVVAGVLHGLHSAHEAHDEQGRPLGIVHRDVSPQNVLVGSDGVPRVLDFGVAKAAGRMQTTKDGQIKGKLAYMPPEQLRGAPVSRQTDIYAVGVMFWELMTAERLFPGDNEGAIVAQILDGDIEAPTRRLLRERRIAGGDPMLRALQALDEVVLRAVSSRPEQRFATAREMAMQIERRCPIATASEVGDWVEHVAGSVLASRAQMVAEIERSGSPLTREATGDALVGVLDGRRRSHGTPQPFAQTLPSREVEPYAPHVEGPTVTQPSSISVSSVSSGDAAARKTAYAAAVGVVLGASVLSLAVLYKRSVDHQTSAATPAASFDAGARDETGASSPPPPLPGETLTATAGLASAPTEPEAAFTETAPTSAVPPVAPASTPSTRPPLRPAGTNNRPPAPPKADCQPPYWFDAQGVKHYKEQCLAGK